MVRTWKSPRILLELLGEAKDTQVISKFSEGEETDREVMASTLNLTIF